MRLQCLVAMVIGAHPRDIRARAESAKGWARTLEETSRVNSKGLAFDAPIKSKAHQIRRGGSTVNTWRRMTCLLGTNTLKED